MKIIFISDIHGKENYLPIIEKLSFDELICLGDIGNNENVDNWLLKYKEKLICLKGNCDYENPLLFTQEDTIKFNVDDINIICNHGNKYSYSKGSPDFSGVLIYGHEHVPYIKKIDNKIYICVGSIGSPRNNTLPCYALYENKTFYIKDINNNIIDKITL